jgi:beta-glucosidase/6-phospho-beta-glucosidase/beta-galactosidase
MSDGFLDHLSRRGGDSPLPCEGCGGPAAQGTKPAGGNNEQRAWDFAFATGIECSNPAVVDARGNRLRRDLLTECGHLERFREDLQLVKELGIPCLRYGLPNHLISLGPDRFDWSFADEAMAQIQRLGITPILDLLHFGIPDWMGDFQNAEMPLHFANYAGAVAQRYPWVRGYTPVNEIYVAARNSGWDGRWNERLRSERGFVTALKHLVAANLLASAAIVRHRPDAIIVQSESAEYTHHIVAAPSHDVKLRNKLIFLSLDLLYSKSPDSDVLMFLLDNGMTRQEFMWFMSSSPSGFQVMGNDYYGHNEKLLLPDGSLT